MAAKIEYHPLFWKDVEAHARYLEAEAELGMEFLNKVDAAIALAKCMIKSQVIDAMHSGHPFVIRTADGKEYPVPTQDHLLISPKGTYVQLVSDDETVTTIPLLTMTAIEYAPQAAVSE